MFKAFKKVAAYTKMANAIDRTNMLLSQVNSQLISGVDPGGLKEEIIGLAFIVRRDIYNPMEEFGWNPIGPIRVNSISMQNISLETALDEISRKVNEISSLCDFQMGVNVKNILAKGTLYHQLDNLSGINKY